ncbi:hypothetical protein BGZ61DRAFT_480797 [Ilyonectria robusta]|uniref:uncharacterized protein n=1 Tax=Ilyonectria robusta TaxID=1079257 RepID=UPI001E8DAAA6|nr:uncharacterized protein BGZ61DRAFT_480797 [Ilyonectria robusta]KAH8683773.1 hypothetical protein BGZ61DRAFT_480797 [Ilyonectria robusta]
MPLRQDEAVDVHSWLSEPGDYACSLGIVGSFYGAIFDLFGKLVKAVQLCEKSRNLASETARPYSHELRRLYLWGDGFSVEEGHLDEILTNASELRHNVLSLLFQLSRVLSSEFDRVVGLDKSQLQGLSEDMADLGRMQEQVGLTLQDSSATQMNPSADWDSVSDSRSSDTGQENLEDISTYIDCLMDLSQAVEHPAMDLFDDPDEESQQEAELFDVSTPQALSYCRKIRDRFPNLPRYLVERLGELNAERALCISRAEAARDLEPGTVRISDKAEGGLDNKSITNPPTESLFSSTNPRLTETTKSTMPTESSLSASPYHPEGVKGHLAPSAAAMIARSKKPAMKPLLSLDFDDTASVATFASYSTTASALSQGRPRIPPLPEAAETSGTFDCPACWRGLRGPMTRTQWKQHIFDDLMPYCCIHEECQDVCQPFQRTKPWAMHLQFHMGLIAWPSTCPFCGPESKRLDREAFLKHVSSHLREVSLAVLPHAARESDDEDNIRDDDSSLLSLTSHRAAKIAGTPGKVESDNGDYSRIPSPDLPRSDSILLLEHGSPRDARLDKEDGDNGDDPESLSTVIFTCELSIYSRCNFASTNREFWKTHVRSHFEGRIPWEGPWECWFCDKEFDQVVDSQEYEQDMDVREPPYLNIPQFYERLDHIADHFVNEGREIENARPSSGLLEWLGPEPQAPLKLTMTRLCTRCGTTSIWDPEVVKGWTETCDECDFRSKPQLMYQYSGEIPKGSRCATEPFGGPKCDHKWAQAGHKRYCLICEVAIDPNSWDHMYVQNARGGWTACCYCGIMLAESSSVNNNRPLTPESVDMEEVRSETEVRSGTPEFKDTKKKGAFARFGERFKRR